MPVHPILTGNTYLVKEHVGLFKAANEYDVYEPASGQHVLACREPDLGWFTKLLRFTEYKRNTPFDIELRTPTGELVLNITRGWTILRANVEVRDAHDRLLGGFRQRLLSIGGKFEVTDADEQPVCMLTGKWTTWEFSFTRGDTELARVTKKWAGLGRELLTTADNYVLEIKPSVGPDDPARPLIVAAVMCIDMVLKE